MPLEPSRYVQGRAMLLAGLRRHHSFAGSARSLAEQWDAFRRLGPLPHQRDTLVYGVLCGADPEQQTFEYMCGAEVAEFDPAAAHLGRMRIPPQYYAVFEHAGPASTLQATWEAIWHEWLPRSGRVRFDPRTGLGGIEVWSPIEPD
jgi:AraC family transcriptional regulator